MKTITCGSREAVVQAIKDLRLGEPTEVIWVRPSGSTTYRFGMDGRNEAIRALANFSTSPEDALKIHTTAQVPTLRGWITEQRARRKDARRHGDKEVVAELAFERRKGRIIRNLMRLPKAACR